KSVYKQLSDRYGKNYPDVIRARSQVEELEAQIKKNVDEYQRNSKAAGESAASGSMTIPNASSLITTSQLQVREKALADEMTELQSDLKDLSAKYIQIESLKEDASNIQEQLDRTKTRIQQLTAENQIGGRVMVISDGDAPFRPFIDRRKQLTALG